MSVNERFKGLNTQEVEESRAKYGSNTIKEKEPPTFMECFKEGFGDPMIQILCVISVLMLVLFGLGKANVIPDSVDWYEPVGTMIAIFLVNFISAKTSMASDSAYRKLKNSTKKDEVKVRRNGKVEVVEIDDIVVGDIVILQAGDKIPADGALVEGDLRVDNSALNGEAEECKKFACPEGFKVPDEITGDTFVDKHSLFKGAIVFNGEGLMEVQKVGMKTMMGKMAEDMAEDEVDSPLKVKLGILAGQISKFGYIGAVAIALAYMVHYVMVSGGVSAWLATGWLAVFQSVIQAVMVAIVIIVCAVPEGLPLMISLVLMQNTGKLLEHNCLVRKPVGIETAGGIKILFSDKTGTITKGKLEVVEVINGKADSLDIKGNSSIGDLINIAIGRNTGSMFDGEHKVVGGNATDQALLKFVGEETFNKLAGDTTYAISDSQGFNSTNKFSQARIDKVGKTFYKGAPERLLAKAKKYINENGEVKDINLEAINKRIDELAERAMRVLAFGYSESDMVEDTINDDLVLIGLVGIRDEVRPEARDAIKEVQDAGIQVVMITGDRLETAVAIAKDAGLLDKNSDKSRVVTINDNLDTLVEDLKNVDKVALTSDVLNKLSDDVVKAIMGKIHVIARALPTDKSRMAKLCQELNLVCGMCGDGVNDSPALKRADVGFAMGSGTEAAKEAGDIVIIDDNFKSIKDAIWYGRTIYHNILKFCKVQLSINVGAVLLSAVAPFIGIEEPLTVTQLLFVNLCMDGLASIMLGNEAALKRYMHEPPRERDESIVKKPMFIQFTLMGIYLMAMSIMVCKIPAIANFIGTPEQAKTAIFPLFIFTAMFNVFNCRAEDMKLLYKIGENDRFFPVWSAVLAVTVAITMFGGKMFGCTPIGINGWLVVLIVAMTCIPFDLMRKAITKSIVGSDI